MTEHFDHDQTARSPLRPPSARAESVKGSAAEHPGHDQRRRSLLLGPRIRVGAVVALALAVGFVAWLVLRDRGSSTKPAQPASASAASVQELQSLAASLGHPIFWLGPKSGYTYELTNTQSGKIYVRYLPPGVEVGANTPYLTVATYPFSGAFAAIQKQAAISGIDSVKLPQGGLAVLDRGYPKSVHAAYPGVDFQIEVFDPTPSAAMQTVAAGHLAALGSLKTTSATPAGPKPAAVSVTGLRSLAASLGHPIYWAGPRPGYTYELTQTSNGNVFIRYLPPGVNVGAPAGYLTVATYPFPNAFAAIQRTSNGNKTGTIRLGGGGLAVVDGQYPKSIHLAYPHSDVQVEVFDPSPARVRQVVSAGKIAAVP
jgi:hypothetical protein